MYFHKYFIIPDDIFFESMSLSEKLFDQDLLTVEKSIRITGCGDLKGNSQV
jgi:hypothetical protein